MTTPADITIRAATPADLDALLEAERAAFGEPEHQRTGIGSALATRGLEIARALGFEIALVLGHPGYYPRFGFEPATPLGIEAPYPIHPAEAWMAMELVPGSFGRATGVVEVAEELRAPEMWRE